MYKNPVFLVDGFTEQKIIQQICSGYKIQKIGLNGNSVSVIQLINAIIAQIYTLKNHFYPIIILVDLEKRGVKNNLSFIEMSQQISENLSKKFPSLDFRIGVADQMIENWIIADWNSFKKNVKEQNPLIDEEKPIPTDGIGGKSKIKKFYPSYKETIDGPKLFAKANHDIIYQNSPSFKFFIDQLIDLKKECHYLNFLPIN